MKKKLETRKSAQYLLSLEGSGRLDSRGELGTVVDIAEWEQKPCVKFHCECEQMKDNEELIPSHLIITDLYLYILRHTDIKNKLVVKSRRTLKAIMKITTKAKMSDMVKIQYGSKGNDGVHITDTDRLLIRGKAGLAIKAIKQALQPSSPQRRHSMAVGMEGLLSPSASARRPSLIAEEHRSYYGSNEELSLLKLRQPPTSCPPNITLAMNMDKRFSTDTRSQESIPLLEMQKDYEINRPITGSQEKQLPISTHTKTLAV